MNNPDSKYHSEITLELQAATPNTSQNNTEITDPRIHRTMSSTTNVEIKSNSNNQGSNDINIELEVATGATPIHVTNNIEVQCSDESTTNTLQHTNLDNLPTNNDTIRGMELKDATYESDKNIEDENNLSSEGSGTEMLQVNTTLKQYDIRKEIPLAETRDLIQSEHNMAPTGDHDLISTMNLPSDNNTLIAELPMLEHYDELNDFESLMTLADDVDNSELVPIGGPPQHDLVRELNKEYGVNSDLEITMENAMFIDKHLLKVASKKGHNKRQSRQTTQVIHTSTPGSPKGRLAVKTHGLRKKGPEERQDKQFKCTNCEFKGYSRASVSDHFSKNHGVVYCETCGKQCPNPHALKRHEYVHSEDKQYVCKTCKESFFFESELKNHRVKHRTGKSFFCMHTGCGRNFRRNSDLNAHVESHTGKIWYCDYDGCDYSNVDKRLLTGHKRIHKKATFHCKYDTCKEVFKHTMSRLRHYEKDH